MDIKEQPYLLEYKGHEADIGVKRKMFKSSTTFSTVIKIIEAIKMP
jgi:hypothetical protein